MNNNSGGIGMSSLLVGDLSWKMVVWLGIAARSTQRQKS